MLNLRSRSVRVREAGARQVAEVSRRLSSLRQLMSPMGAALLGLAIVPNLAQADPRRTDVDPPAGDQVTVNVASAAMAEGDGGASIMRFTVTVAPLLDQPISIPYRVIDRSATCGDHDYQSCSGILVIPANQASAEIDVTVYGDLSYEADESFWLMLDTPANALVADGVATGTIVNDDRHTTGSGGPRRLPDIAQSEGDPRRTEVDPPAGGAPASLTVESGSQREGDSGVTLLRFKVNAQPVSSEPISVAWHLADASATCANKDYEAASGILTLPAYASSGEISVAVYGDQAFEADEAFLLMLSDAVGAQLIETSAVGVILNDDRRGAAGGQRRLPESGIGMEGDHQVSPQSDKKAISWGGLKALYR